MTAAVLSQQIRVNALKAGFDLAGIAPLAAWQDLEFARSWVEKGYAGEMAYLRNPKRADPRLILPSAQSVVCVGLVYNAALPHYTDVTGARDSGLATRGSVFGFRDSDFRTEEWRQTALPPTTNAERRTHAQVPDGESRTPKTEPLIPSPTSPEPRVHGPEPRGWISRYAWGRDYHNVMRSRLERLRTAIEKLAPGVDTRVYVDTGPIVERAFARLSGIGWVGKNTCLINQQRGSWFFIGVILTSLDLEPDAPAFDRCGSCTRCLDACPTGALVQPYVMDASRCIAYLNIELRGSIPPEFRPAIGANVFGCDICQDVCPWNRDSGFRTHGSGPHSSGAPVTALDEFQPMMVGPREEPSGAESLACEARTANPGLPDPEPRTPNPGTRSFSLFNPRLEDLASLTEDDFRRFFRDSPIKRAKYHGWLRN